MQVQREIESGFDLLSDIDLAHTAIALSRSIHSSRDFCVSLYNEIMRRDFLKLDSLLACLYGLSYSSLLEPHELELLLLRVEEELIKR